MSDLQSRCWSQAQCLRVKWPLHFQTCWLNCLKGPPPSNCKESQWFKKKKMQGNQMKKAKILTVLPVRWTPVKFCVCRFVHFHPDRPVEKAEAEWAGKWNLWLGQWSFTSVEEKWRQLLCCLTMSWTDWPDCHRDYRPGEGSSAQGLVWLNVRLRRSSQLNITNDWTTDLFSIGITCFTYRCRPRSLCF